jgi:hypothetical protein
MTSLVRRAIVVLPPDTDQVSSIRQVLAIGDRKPEIRGESGQIGLGLRRREMAHFSNFRVFSGKSHISGFIE